ncbi:hypothetical protein Ndes2526B_g03520 [Nannochloris sp. 'desiccata']
MAASTMQMAAAPAAVVQCSRSNVNKANFMGARLPMAKVHSVEARRCQSIIVSAATMDKSLGPDKWNDTYYPTGADAAAVHKPWGYTPSMDMGSFVIVINAEKVAVTGAKETDKTYFRHTTGRPGGGKIEALRDLRVRIPERIIEKAVRGMLPNGRIGNALYTHLKVYKGASHPHTAQKPVDITKNISKKPSEATPM